jgi:hypothetical protein
MRAVDPLKQMAASMTAELAPLAQPCGEFDPAETDAALRTGT